MASDSPGVVPGERRSPKRSNEGRRLMWTKNGAMRAGHPEGRRAQAIEVAHRQGEVHRDRNPANVLLTPDGEPKGTDFGLARIEGERQELTVTGDVLGTPAY